MNNKFWIINSYGNDFSWVDDYTDNYIIYDKTCSLPETDKIKHQPNFGYNIYDYCYYIINNYDNIPDICVFIKDNVFKHCKKEVFDTLIKNDCFTSLEYYGTTPANAWESRTPEGGFLEINNSWYVGACIQTYGKEVNRYFKTFDAFLDEMFSTPVFSTWVRFAPGANYIVPKKNILFYSLKFWEKIFGYVSYHQYPSEAHIVERAMYYIFTNKWKEKKIK